MLNNIPTHIIINIIRIVINSSTKVGIYLLMSDDEWLVMGISKSIAWRVLVITIF